MKKNIILCAGLFLGLLLSCSIKPRGWEADGVIAVMADKSDWEFLQGPLKKTFERIIRTPQPEPTYVLRYVNTEEFETYTDYHNLILMATLESTGKIGGIVNKAVSNPQVRAQVENGERFLIIQQNQWSRNQQMMILVGKDIEMLQNHIIENDIELYRHFDEICTRKLESEMFEKKEQKELEDRIMRTYNWSIRLQHDYFLAQEFPKEGFLWFRRLFPERWIFVRWIDGADSSLLSKDWVLNERNRIGASYYGGDTVANAYLFSYQGEFLGRPAQITQGLWENDEKVKGGPFKNYTFYDEYTQRVYMIDLAIHAPEREKMPYLKRHEIIAQSFRTIFDMEIEK